MLTMILRMGFLIAAVAKYRMDNMPPLLQPWFILYGYGVGLAQFAYHCLIHWTCRIRYEGREALPGRNVIYCVGHGDLQSYFSVFLRHRRHTWMMHPSWYMKPIEKRWPGKQRRFFLAPPLFSNSACGRKTAALFGRMRTSRRS